MHAAANILEYMDNTVDPCTDFYAFACAKFISETALTDEKVSVDTFSVARDQMQKQLLQLIDSPVNDNEELK